MPRWGKVVTGALAAVLLAMIVIGAVMSRGKPLVEETWATCRTCRAQRCEKRRLAWPVSSRVIETPFSRYYRKSVDPGHKHDWWVWTTSTRELRHPFMKMVGCRWGRPGKALDDRMLLTILKSLPDARTRKVVMGKICTDFSSPSYKSVEHSLLEVQKAHKEDPNRKDWAAVLKRCGLYPEM